MAILNGEGKHKGLYSEFVLKLFIHSPLKINHTKHIIYIRPSTERMLLKFKSVNHFFI